MNTLTIEDAIKLVPSIGSSGPSEKVSNKYQFVSSKDILNSVQEYNWKIVDVKSQSKNPFSQHRVTLIQEKDVQTAETNSEGVMRIEMFNSHNCTKRLMFAVGFFRFVCSNGLIIANGPADCLRLRHRFTQDKLKEIMDHVSNISERFPRVMNQIEDFKQRELSEEEQISYAKLALLGKFRYRQNTPKRYADINRSAEMLLAPRRQEDEGNSTWLVYNRIQENIIKGIADSFRPVRGYGDNIRINQLLWKGAELSMSHSKESLDKQYKELLVKDGKKGKISV